MTDLIKKKTRQLEGFAWAIKQQAQGEPPPVGETWEDRISDLAEKIAKTTAEMADYEPDEPHNPDPDEPYTPPYTKEERDKVLAMPVWDEIRYHTMALPGKIYRDLKTTPKETKDLVYELARQTRIMGAKYLRSFLINGSRDFTERYIMDALPWQMVRVKQGNKYVWKVDFSKRNEYYFDCVRLIEEACNYWGIHHQPTFFMARYNEDIFDSRFNVNGVNGYRSADALGIKQAFITDFLDMQHESRPDGYKHCMEIENEPFHHGNHYLGALIADQNLAMYRTAEAHGARIDEFMTCSGTSEFSHANFVEEHWFPTIHRTLGFAEFESRKVKPEWHGASTLNNLLNDLDWDRALGSGWRHLCNNEDAANDGSYNPIPWTPYRQANYDEFAEMCLYAITTASARNKRWIITIFAMDCLEVDPDDGIAKETYDLERMDFHRCHAPRDVRLDLEE